MDDYFRIGNTEEYDEQPEESSIDPDLFSHTAELLEKNDIPFEDDEVPLYASMFRVMRELAKNSVSEEELAQVFMPMTSVMEDDDFVTARDKMKGMYRILEEHDATSGKMDNKDMLFVAFCVYLACSVISEKDDKKHRFMGLPEFESADYVKYRMEEYWAMDSFMFTFAL